MNTFKARGIVLRAYDAGESDRRLTLLCKERGRLTVYARGARKPKSKFMAAAQLFAYADYVLADGGAFLSLAQASVIESFPGLAADYDLLLAASFALEICERAILPGVPADDLLRLLLHTLARLNRPGGRALDSAGIGAESSVRLKSPSARQTSLVFWFRFFLCSGFMPELNACCGCGRETNGEPFALCDEGLLCARCGSQKPLRAPLSKPALTALRHICVKPLPQAFGFKVEDTALTELLNAGRLLWDSHFQDRLKTLAMMDADFLDGL